MSKYSTFTRDNCLSGSWGMTTVTRNKMEQELRCPTCRRWFQSPLLLPCGHSLCTPCAVNSLTGADEATAGVHAAPDLDDQSSQVSETDSGVVINSRPGSYVGMTTTPSVVNLYLVASSHGPPVHGLVCPLCRRVALLDARGVEGLTRNRALENVVDKFAITSAARCSTIEGEEAGSILCQLCDEMTSAEILCEQCEIYYCTECRLRCHPSRGPLAQHTLHGAIEGREVLRQKRKQKSTQCSEHPEEVTSLFCIPCRLPVCCVCARDNHTRHDTQPLNQICKAQKADLSQLLQSLSEKAKSGTEFIQSLKMLSEKVGPNSIRFQDSMIAQIDAMIATLEEKKQTLLGYAISERDHKIRTYKDQICQSTATLTRTTSLIHFCFEMLKESDPSSFLQVSHSLVSRSVLADRCFFQEMEMKPRVSHDFEIRVDTEELEKTIRSLGFNEFKAPGIPTFIPEECCSEGNVITFVWRPFPGSSVDFYSLELDDGVGGHFRKVYRGADTICTVEGLHFKAVYRARVKAHNHAGESHYSQPICLQTADLAWFTFETVSSLPDLIFSNNNLTLTSVTSEDRVALCGTGFSRGVHYWEFTVDRCEAGAQPAFGVARHDCARDTMLGRDRLGWSMYIDVNRSWFLHANDHFERTDGGITTGTVIGIRLDCDKGHLSYYLNDDPHGPIAFTGLGSGILYPAVSLTRHVQVTLHTGIEVPSESEDSSEDDHK